jgi:hypothetical protein
MWPVILPSDSTKEADSLHSPLGHIGHFDPVFLPEFLHGIHQ